MIQDILIKAMISSFCESMYLSYFRFQSNAWQDEGVIFFLSQVSQWRRCEFFYLSFAKKSRSCLKVSLIKNYQSFIIEIISSFWENIYFELFSFSVKRAARRECDVLLTSLEVANFLFLVCSIFSLGEKKSRSCLSLHSFTTNSNSLY